MNLKFTFWKRTRFLTRKCFFAHSKYSAREWTWSCYGGKLVRKCLHYFLSLSLFNSALQQQWTRKITALLKYNVVFVTLKSVLHLQRRDICLNQNLLTIRGRYYKLASTLRHNEWIYGVAVAIVSPRKVVTGSNIQTKQFRKQYLLCFSCQILIFTTEHQLEIGTTWGRLKLSDLKLRKMRFGCGLERNVCGYYSWTKMKHGKNLENITRYKVKTTGVKKFG